MPELLMETEANHPPTAPSGQPNMPAIMEGLAQVQDGLRTMTMNGAILPMPRSLLTGYLVLLVAIPNHSISVMDGENSASMTFAVDGRPVMEGWPE